MVKQGPCCHCGITTTPLWRNGPPDKPVLCNACGSRWRTKATLKNYVPMHSGGFGIATKNNVSCDWFRDKSGHQDLSKGSFNKRSYKKYANNQREPSSFMKENQDVRSNMSTMGFCINELPMTNSNCYNSEHRPLPHFVPSKKRTLRTRYRASREKLKNRKTTLDDLQTFSSTCLSKVEIAIERSLKENFTQEIQLSLLGTEEGSKFSKTMCMKSSTDLDIKFLVQLAHSPSPSKRLAGGKEDKQAWKKFEGGPVHSKRISIPNKALLENFPYSKRDVLSSSQSPLIFLELKDILNFDTFASLLSDQERGQLMQFVSFADFSNIPESLKRMFKSSQFEGALANFQQLLSEGMFDYSELGISPNVLGHYQQLLDLTDLAASGWMEHCSQLQTRSTRRQPLGLSRGYQIKKKTKKKARKPLEHIGSASADCADGKFLSGCHPRKLPQKNNGGLDGNSISSVGASSSPQHRRVYPEIGGGRFSHAVRSGKLRSFSDESHSIKLSPGARSYFISKNFSRAQIERKLFSESIYSTILSENGEENDDDNGMLVNVPSNMYYQEAVLLQEPHSKSNEPKGSLDNSDSKDFVHKFNY